MLPPHLLTLYPLLALPGQLFPKQQRFLEASTYLRCDLAFPCPDSADFAPCRAPGFFSTVLCWHLTTTRGSILYEGVLTLGVKRLFLRADSGIF